MVDNRQTVLITGGEGDLGKALGCAFQGEQWTVLNPGRKELNVESEESVESYFDTLPKLDLLVNNAGMIDDQLITRMSERSWDEVISVNLRGAFLCTRAAVRKMQPHRNGQVVFIGSRSARFGAIGQSNYAASKAALIGFSQSLAREYGSENLRFNVVLPGFLETRMNHEIDGDLRQTVLDQHVLGRFNTIECAARCVVCFASLEHVSGQIFQLDSRIDAWT